MKCKDCIHYAAHKHFYFGEDEKDFDEYFNDDNVESQCPEFEDKKEWVKLPCKVGPPLFGCSLCRWCDDDTTTGSTSVYNYCPNCGAKMDGKE